MCESLSSKPLTLLEWKVLRYMARPYAPGAETSAYYPCALVTEKTVSLYPGRNFTSAAKRAVRAIFERGFLEADAFGNLRLTATARAFAGTVEKPAWTPPSPPALQERDWETLRGLEFANRSLRTCGVDEWVAPLDCGGGDGTYHSASLAKLTHHGFAACRQIGSDSALTGPAIVPEPHLFHRSKGSRVFLITESGRKALADHYGDILPGMNTGASRGLR